MSLTITVITICFNNPEELKATCASVDRQSMLPYEHWIIDGSTGTGIKDWLESTPQPSYRKWLSEKDNGIADAFNKGVQRAGGDILNMLNAGDYYFDENTISLITGVFATNPSLAWVHGKYQLQRGGVWVIIGKPFEKRRLYRGMRSLSHQSLFVKKELHRRYGLYDKGLKNAMDYDFVCRIAGEPADFIEEPLVVFAPGGTTYTNYINALKEARKVYEKYFGYSLKLVLWQFRLRLLYYLLNSPAGTFLYKVKVWLRLENM
jgi:glycosyltransferase involved in cell wall biosynthesis